MTFDLAKFEATEFHPREKEIKVPALAGFFDGDPVWTVRGLSANEIYKATDAEQKRSLQSKILKAAASFSGDPDDILKEISANEDTPGEIAKRLEMLVMGSVEPTADLALAVKLAKVYPIEFMHLTNEITTLTGQGFDYAKPEAASSETQD